ncbi:MAG TPA: succinate dehydrogenase, hydrophobic membrane anchor protein [Caulobacteraceae bacterium]|nr:succinate dehydrogenase, hydrophobic membrane anchor protein [Caulobacteraceae bacterium]
MASLRTPLGRARGYGAAKSGVGGFIAERVTGAALVILVLWAVRSAFTLAGAPYDDARVWLASPVNLALGVLLAITAFHHMRIGMGVIIEDYIERPAAKVALLTLNAFVCWGAAALAVVSLLSIAFGRAPGLT